MATHYGSSRHPWIEMLIIVGPREAHETIDTDIKNASILKKQIILKNLELNNPVKLTALTREIDELHQCVQVGEGQPTKTLPHIECKLQRLSISLNPLAPTEPLGEVIRHYTNTLCSAQKQTNLTNSLLQDIPIFYGHDTIQLKDWLVDIETAADLTTERRTKYCSSQVKRFNM